MLKRIKILNFRGIKEGVIDDLKQVTLIIGKNGSGKSSILEALYAVSAYAEDYDEIRGIRKLDYIINRRGNRGLWDDARQSIWYLQDVENPIIISLSLNSEEYEFTILNTKIINNPVQLRSPSGRVEALFEEYLGRILFIDGRLLLQPEKIEKYAWSRVVAKRLDKLIVSMIREEFEEEAEGLTYIPIGNTYYLALQTSETTIRIDDLGDGARTALLTALLTIAYKPTLILIEEPELHMHPAGLYTYMKFLLKQARELNFQIIATTHSIELIHIIQDITKEEKLELAIIFIEREKGVLKTRNFSPEDTEILKKLGTDPQFLYKF